MAVIGQGISHRGLIQEKFHYAFFLASGITNADVGKAVAIDTGAASTVKLAGDDDVIMGRLEVVEDRSVEGVLVGTVATRGGFGFPIKSGETINVGDTVIGAGDGEVKAALTADYTSNICVKIDGDIAEVLI